MPSVDSETRSEIKRIADYLNKKKSAKTLNYSIKRSLKMQNKMRWVRVEVLMLLTKQ